MAPDPQLAVCKGLVGDHVRSLKAGKPVLKWRCCRASYGTICKEIYDKDNPMHVGRQTEKDPMNGKVYVTQSIAWFIKKVCKERFPLSLSSSACSCVNNAGQTHNPR